MEMDVLDTAKDLAEITAKACAYFEQELNVHKEKLSMFEAYQVRPKQKFIPQVWKYRIVANKGQYFFGKLKDKPPDELDHAKSP